MQLPGMSTDPVRVSLDVTWWPADDNFTYSHRLWARRYGESEWRMEGMVASGTPLTLLDLRERWPGLAAVTLRDLMEVVGHSDGVGPFD